LRKKVKASGSIPAQAGEPLALGGRFLHMGVHPRAGGGASICAIIVPTGTGPSPRRRGSRCLVLRTCHDGGSIPAQAGEPLPRSAHLSRWRVHPRAGGGAGKTPARPDAIKGPSPRRRGSRDVQLGLRLDDGSIPAQAGEPRRAARSEVRRRVHPRAGGGAATCSSV
jgi:hypothetical protein